MVLREKAETPEESIMSTEKMNEKLSRIRESGNRVSESALIRMISGNKQERPNGYEPKPSAGLKSSKSDPRSRLPSQA